MQRIRILWRVVACGVRGKRGCFGIGMSTNEGVEGLLLWDFVLSACAKRGEKRRFGVEGTNIRD